MFDDTPEYIIKPQSAKEFAIYKFLFGKLQSTYRYHDNKCDCLSGRYRNYCKHKDWIGLVKKHKKLPNGVMLAEEANV